MPGDLSFCPSLYVPFIDFTVDVLPFISIPDLYLLLLSTFIASEIPTRPTGTVKPSLAARKCLLRNCHSIFNRNTHRDYVLNGRLIFIERSKFIGTRADVSPGGSVRDGLLKIRAAN